MLRQQAAGCRQIARPNQIHSGTQQRIVHIAIRGQIVNAKQPGGSETFYFAQRCEPAAPT